MIQKVLEFFSGNGIAVIIAVFVFVSAMLSAAQALLVALGKKVPGWLGKAIEILGKIVGFINGNFKKPEVKV